MPKNIILFSDGTGNSSAKLFKTNVWRLYEALDLGPPVDGRDRVQIAYYDNGVGTSNFRPLAMLGGVFGFGLKRNVLTIYKYLCRNYVDGDAIYCFGFSRGAFTIRLVAGMIASQGVVDYRNERQLAYHARDAYREFCRAMWPNRWPARMLAKGIRRLRDGVLRAKRFLFREKLYRTVPKRTPDIAFLGVWDTVAAYGGPIAEITRGIDDYIWPLTMPDYELSPKVLKARHALSLDDKRDSFQPVLWDEVREADVAAKGRMVSVGRLDGGYDFSLRTVPPGRLEQIWFAGVHSDVGGGYPDETLSYVSLQWMIGEADGLFLLDQHRERIRTMENPFGPIHNSRAGLGSYYRFQPRNLAALIDPDHDPGQPRHLYRLLRDPEVKRDGFGDHALLTEIKLHKSVVSRIANGTDRYAPVNIPPHYFIYPTDPGEHPKEGGDPAAERLPVDRDGTEDQWARVWDFVWWRRLTYFVTVFLSLTIASMPLWPGTIPNLRVCDDARCWGRSAIGLLDYVLPQFATVWTRAFTAHAGWFLALVALVALTMGIGGWLEKKMSDVARSLLARRARAKHPGFLAVRRIRESPAYQYIFFNLKWRLLPFLAALATIAALLLLALSIVTQGRLYLAERSGVWGKTPLCLKTARQPEVRNTSAPALWPLASLCAPLGVSVVEGSRYEVVVRVPKDGAWSDGGYAPAQVGAPVDLPLLLDLAAPLRRIIVEPWFQPMIAIRSRGGNDIAVDRLALTPRTGEPGAYRGEFQASRDGNLGIFVNDAVLPLTPARFYANNRGAAWVTVTRTDRR